MTTIVVRIPKLAMTTEEGTPTEWLVPEGGSAREGDALYSLETDKVETEIDSPATGIVHWTAILGRTYPVGTEIGVIVVGP
jgi:pyruvate/2-oxoglutarate dehydrogenase complex dihydrolipoamide acyltransferase (E2) component